MATNLREIYQIKITLKGIRPPIWRRFLVRSNIKLDEFHEILQIVMGWSNSHLHGFVSGDTVYSEPDPDFDLDEIEDERKVKLASVLTYEGDKLRYDYDFGDNWEHDVVLEKILPFTPKQQLPFCLKGKRACPPEDCGGIWGYQNLLNIISNPEHEDHDEWLEWLPENFDPESFSADNVNRFFHE